MDKQRRKWYKDTEKKVQAGKTSYEKMEDDYLEMMGFTREEIDRGDHDNFFEEVRNIKNVKGSKK